MTRDEFREWFRHHCSAFTGLGAWFSRLPAEAAEIGIASQAGTLRSWYGVLHTTELADAIEATRVMFRDTSDVHFDKHPAQIRSLASKLAGARWRATVARSLVNQEPRVRCPECLDSGYRRVVHGQTVRDYRAGRMGFIYTCAVACLCAIGDDRFPDQERDGRTVRYPRYDPKRHCLVDVKTCDGWTVASMDEMRQMLAAWLSGDQQRRIERQDADNWEPLGGQSYAEVCG